MKIVNTLVLVSALAISHIAFAGKAKTSSVAAAELNKTRQEFGLEKDFSGRGRAVGDKAFETAINKAAPMLSQKTGLTADKITTVLRAHPEALDAIILNVTINRNAKSSEELKDVSRTIEMMVDALAKGEIDANDPSNLTIAKILELLANAEAYPDSVVTFAKEISSNLNGRSSLPEAIQLAASKFAKQRGMTVSKWMEELLKCLKNV